MDPENGAGSRRKQNRPAKLEPGTKKEEEIVLAIEVKEEAEEEEERLKLKCGGCGTEFMSATTLAAHQQFYCSKKEAEQRSEAEQSLPNILSGTPEKTPCSFIPPLQIPLRFPLPFPSPTTSVPPNSILLPVARHSRPGIEVVGPPQLFVPVAVPETRCQALMAQFPVLIEEMLLNGAKIFPECQPDKKSNRGEKKGFQAPLVKILPSPIQKPIARVASTVPPKKRKLEEPLDLSFKETDVAKTPRNSSEKNQDIQRNFFCDNCGIKFSSLKTLTGHQTYYCQSAKLPNGSDPAVVSSPSERGTPELTCSQCPYAAATSNQLSQHIRNTHEAVQGYLCEVCGYIGYSLRGMKSHMKSHLNSPGLPNNLDELRNLYVKPLASTTPSGSPKVHIDGKSSSVSPALSDYKHKTDEATKNKEEPMGDEREEYSCQLCPYKSQYKGNVKRHSGLIHKLAITSDASSEGEA